MLKLTYGIKKDIEECVRDWISSPQGIFSWVDDGLCTKTWGYDVHIAWVCAWNTSGRLDYMDVFILKWLKSTDYIRECANNDCAECIKKESSGD